MKVLFNVVGPADRVTKLIEACQKGTIDRVVVDTFPPKNPNLRDVNIEVEEGKSTSSMRSPRASGSRRRWYDVGRASA